MEVIYYNPRCTTERSSYNNHICIIHVANNIFLEKDKTYNYQGHTPEVDALCARLVHLCAECEGPTTCSGPSADLAKQFNLNAAFLHPHLILCKAP
jgi:hypothetical protein